MTPAILIGAGSWAVAIAVGVAWMHAATKRPTPPRRHRHLTLVHSGPGECCLCNGPIEPARARLGATSCLDCPPTTSYRGSFPHP